MKTLNTPLPITPRSITGFEYLQQKASAVIMTIIAATSATACAKIEADAWNESRCPVSETRGEFHAISPFCNELEGDAGTDNNDTDTDSMVRLNDGNNNTGVNNGNNNTGVNNGNGAVVITGDNTRNNVHVTYVHNEGSGDTNVEVHHHNHHITNIINEVNGPSSYFYDTYRERIVAISNNYANSIITTPVSLDYIDRFLKALDYFVNNQDSSRLSQEAFNAQRVLRQTPEMIDICNEIITDIRVKAPQVQTPDHVIFNYCNRIITVR